MTKKEILKLSQEELNAFCIEYLKERKKEKTLPPMCVSAVGDGSNAGEVYLTCTYKFGILFEISFHKEGYFECVEAVHGQFPEDAEYSIKFKY